MRLPLDNWPRDEAHRCAICDRHLADHEQRHLDACCAVVEYLLKAKEAAAVAA